MQSISRRHVLRGIGGAAIPLPFLDAMTHVRSVRADTPLSRVGRNGRPKRFVILFTGSGQGPDWFNNSVGPDGNLVLSDCMSPLERHKNDLILIDGLNMRTAMADKSSVDAGHAKPSMHMLTCMPVTPNQRTGGISIDQEIAKKIGVETKFPSLQLGVQGGGFSNASAEISLPNINDPENVFRKLFADFKTDPGVFQRARAKRKSILDGVRQDLEDFVPKVGADDRRKIQAHLDGVREVEKLVGEVASVVTSDACSAPVAPAGKPGNTNAEYVSVGNVQMELLAMALACDLTRVVTLTFRGPANGVGFPSIGITNLHDTSHTDKPGRNRASKWHAEYFADFFDRLKKIKDGPGSLFDNTLIYWCSEHGAGGHNYDRMTNLVVGSAGGYFKTGQRLVLPDQLIANNESRAQPSGVGHGNLFVSFLNAMGVPATTFGQPEHCTGPLVHRTGNPVKHSAV